MLNNDILRRVRYLFNYNDKQMKDLFHEGGVEVSEEKIKNWLSREEDESFESCHDINLSHFLNGLIYKKRGRKEGVVLSSDKRLSNNIILKKMSIALNLRSDDILKILESVDFKISKHELSAFFRKKDHKHYRECKDQILRNFLTGVQEKFSKKA